MTRYVDVKDVGRLVGSLGLNRVIRNMASYIEADYRRWPSFDKAARVANHSSQGVIELMPTDDGELYSFKYVNGHPKNIRFDMLTVMAFGVLAEVKTGYPLLLSELTLTTAIRTAATSALLARFLARKNSRSMALIGNGAQSEFQAIAFHELLGIEEIRIFDIDPAAMMKLQQNLAGIPGLKVIPATSVRESVRGADIVTTVTADKTNATILTADMLEPGMHLNAVGGDCPGKTELQAEILQQARVIVEFEPQTRVEGEIQQMPADFPVVEFYQVLSGAAEGRQNDQQVTIFDSVGFALEDFSALRYLYDATVKMNIGQTIDLVPTPANPKDLYQLTMPTSSLLPAAEAEWRDAHGHSVH
ncbi:ornithine cyclodeaminase [Pseudomonas schmalbachii]|uniref:Ornithine cyclodeaminase n=1 Tax=Pseudomonas schmalbachii TaxID=2816993 RepID=A0ABS3TKV1_9PSED|nr:ornithine cyclodeaminase [Pseudomonas schmalbachii]MBO3274277.1 ornithine cyclodeaminase [Pseudomonas schmalbachii]